MHSGTSPSFSLLLVGALAARPRINLEPRTESLRLELAEAVADAFVVLGDAVYTSEMQVSSWRSSLRTAFENGFSGAFAPSRGEDDLVLRLERADLYFDDKDSGATTIIDGPTVRLAPSVRVACNLQYRAYLLDQRKTIRARDVGTARFANGRWTRRDLMVGALAQMFEQVAERFFGDAAEPVVLRPPARDAAWSGPPRSPWAPVSREEQAQDAEGPPTTGHVPSLSRLGACTCPACVGQPV